MLNSIAVDCGHPPHFPDLSMPMVPTDIAPDDQETIGFEIYHEDYDAIVSNIREADHSTSGADSDDSDDSVEDDILPINHIALYPEEHADQNNAETIAQLHDHALEELEEGRSTFNRTILPAETTMDAFKRLAGLGRWVPFSQDKESGPTAQTEHAVFIQMETKYSRKASPSSTNGYNAFMKAWNLEAGRRMIASFQNEDNNQSIFYKSRIQLQEYYDRLKELQDIAAETTLAEAAARHALNRQLLEARLQQSEPITHQAVPLHYNINHTPAIVPLGHPIQLTNVEVYKNDVGVQPSAANMAPFQMNFTPPGRVRQIKMDWRIYCSVCCKTKRDHPRVGATTDFGQGRCKSIICGVCRRRKSDHADEARRRNMALTENSRLMGRYCIFN